MFQKTCSAALAAALLLTCVSCTTTAGAAAAETKIVLSDSGVTVNGDAASTSSSAAVYTGADIVYYESGKDATYGEGTDADAHTAAEAEAHTVVTITQPGTYRVSGTLSAGQLAVDLGDDASADPDAVVTLILDNANITCTVAPAVIFYNVYECSAADAETATATVDTSAAGANVIIADGTVNNITGSYVAKIYKEGTDKKLHKYDGAFYSKMSMNITGEREFSGILNINADNEGLDSELHLTINGGVISIRSENDGINTNEDGVSVTTVNNGVVTIYAGGGAEGDGIDSNGFIVINGGIVTTVANATSGDGGLDADGGIYLNGGTVFSEGSRNDEISADSAQAYMELSFASPVDPAAVITVQDADGNTVLTYQGARSFQAAVFSAPELALDETYTVYVDGVQQQYTGTGSGMMGGMGGQRPDGAEMPDGTQRPDDAQRPTGEPPEGTEGKTPPEGMENGTPPDGDEAMTPPDGAETGKGGGRPGGMGSTAATGTASTEFTLTAQSKSFSGVSGAALPFTDVTAGTAQYEAIETLYRAGIMNGTGDTEFSPDATVSRAMAVTVLGRMAEATAADGAAFTDVVNGTWYSGYVGWASGNGYVQGDGQGHFYPDSAVTGAEMELILTRYAQAGGMEYTAANTSTAPLTRGELAEMLVKLM